MDTKDESFPAPLNDESFPINLRLYEQVKRAANDPYSNKVIGTFQESLNKRITHKLSEDRKEPEENLPQDLASTVLFASKYLNLSLNELVAIPS